jgi:hypothetical protein
MPFKHTDDRHHKFDKAPFNVTNGSEYNESLRRRGDITVWIDDSVADAWAAPASNRRGKPATYSNLAIETCLTVRSVFGLALRQTQGFMRSVFRLLELDLPVPDRSTLSRRTDGLELCKRKQKRDRIPATLVIDSTGLKVFGAGEWQETQHGTKKKRRKWRKLHLGLDLESGEILGCELTEDHVGDPTVVPNLLDQIDGAVATFLGDGAYDGAPTRQEIEDRYGGVEVIIPPPKTAVLSAHAESAPSTRDRDILLIETHGRMGWQKQKGYGRRSRGETLMGRYKQVFGTTLKSRKWENQKTVARINGSVLNKMTALGRPAFERVGAT